jgi:hypothetical protein
MSAPWTSRSTTHLSPELVLPPTQFTRTYRSTPDLGLGSGNRGHRRIYVGMVRASAAVASACSATKVEEKERERAAVGQRRAPSPRALPLAVGSRERGRGKEEAGEEGGGATLGGRGKEPLQEACYRGPPLSRRSSTAVEATARLRCTPYSASHRLWSSSALPLLRIEVRPRGDAYGEWLGDK